MKPDPWLAAARHLAEVARSHPGVAGLAESGPVETRGRGAPVRGIALRAGEERAVATVAVTLHTGAVTEAGGLTPLVRSLRHALLDGWRRLDTGLPLDLHVQVLDLVPPGPAPASSS
ncbi:hypothetical protein GQ464_007910 [Rhodocaloribacter litoris]|uniref:hypothetical protein n=1 Tax=Rhodocaloribacter litoris TaxID=2558931 RepID=UPI001E463993|nr:hypothetical protein [Rhodocaloribacter litoris]QXD16852.1 hypothetical protein GQ464_007910 [Rhodocaloribacter litoris]